MHFQKGVERSGKDMHEWKGQSGKDMHSNAREAKDMHRVS